MNQFPMEVNNRKLLVLKCAVVSRLVVMFLAILWRRLLSPYDTSASINPGCLTSESNSHAPPVLLPRVAAAIENGIVWDSVYFVRIAQCGYEYEQSYAFFPLLPISISLLSRTVFSPLIPVIGHRAVLGLSGCVLNNIAFVLAALYLYRLSVIVVKDSGLAMRASLLFCFNPASVFYSSMYRYTESLYALFSIGGLYYFTSGAQNIATLWFALSGVSRSNGMLNAGYICFQMMHSVYSSIVLKKHAIFVFWELIAGAIRSICVIFPFVAFQAYGYYNMCVVGHSPNSWCKKRIPLFYDYIQGHYWGVGFLRYFQIKQIPNFLLASPVLSLALCSIIHYVKLEPEVFLSLGFRRVCSPNNDTKGGQDDARLLVMKDDTSNKLKGGGDSALKQRKQVATVGRRQDFTALETGKTDDDDNLLVAAVIQVPLVLHLGFMTATAFLVMHVQVATRFLSASPPLYWFSSYVMMSASSSSKRSIEKRGFGGGYCIWVYCWAYIFLGTLLFSNFYPFT